MCRKGDVGPYSLENIYKGTARENTRTNARLQANKRAQRAKEDHQKYLDALMWAQSKEPEEWVDDDVYDRLKESGAINRAPSMGILLKECKQ